MASLRNRLRWALACAALIGLAGGACWFCVRLSTGRAWGWGPPHDHDPTRDRALALVAQGRFAEAEAPLVRIVNDLDRVDPEADEALARVFLQTYKLDLAARVLRKWMRDAPEDARPYLWHTEIDRRTETSPETTIQHYRAALDRDPNLDPARLGLAEVLQNAHRAAEAAPEYERYLARHPDDLKALVLAGQNARELGQDDQALKYLERALAIQPDHAIALKARALLRAARDDLHGALDDLDHAIATDPYDQEAYYRRGLVLSRLNQPDRARADQDRAAQLRREAEQLDDVRRRLNANPHDNDLRLQVARWLLDHGQTAAGLEWTSVILASQPDHQAALRLLVDYYQRTGEPGRANYYRLQLRP